MSKCAYIDTLSRWFSIWAIIFVTPSQCAFIFQMLWMFKFVHLSPIFRQTIWSKVITTKPLIQIQWIFNESITTLPNLKSAQTCFCFSIYFEIYKSIFEIGTSFWQWSSLIWKLFFYCFLYTVHCSLFSFQR